MVDSRVQAALDFAANPKLIALATMGHASPPANHCITLAKEVCRLREAYDAKKKESDWAVDRLAVVTQENRNLKYALTGAWVDYDHCPYQLATDEIDRLGVGAGLYQLDEQAVEDAAKHECNYLHGVDNA